MSASAGWRLFLPGVLAAAVLWACPAPSLAVTRERAIARFDPRVGPAERVRLVHAAGGRVVRDLHLIGALGVEMAPARLGRFARLHGVRGVTPDSVVRPAGEDDCDGRWEDWCPGALATAFVQSTRVDKVWTDPRTPATGAGVGVAVIDTGIAGDLPDFKGADGSSRVIATAVANVGASTATDRYGHGTHVAGLLAGNGRRLAPTDPLYNRYIGTAPNAQLISIKASDDDGQASIIDVIDGLQFAVDHQDTYGIRVVNLSLTSSDAQSQRTDPLDGAVEAAWFAGLVVVTAAGNRGDAPDAVSYAPANDPFVITIGGVDDQATKATRDDALAPWSSHGVTQDGFTKPDLVAPAAHMVAPLAPDSSFADLCPSCIVDARYFRVGGTSMAAAVVSGIAADLLQAHPQWTPDQVKQALMTRTRPTLGDAREVAADHALKARPCDPTVNAGLTPSSWIDPETRTIDYTRASWSQASWTQATGPLRAAWSRASWRCAECGSGGPVDPSRASWRRASWGSFFGDTPRTFGELHGGRAGAANPPDTR